MQPVTAADHYDIATPADPRLSPDGERVAFLRRQPIDERSSESTVYVVDVDGGAPRRLTLPGGTAAEPRWSPSGDRIAFTATRGADDRRQLWVLPTDGGEARRVTDVVGDVSAIAWAPDGDRIAFVQSVTEADRAADRDLSVPEGYEPDDRPDPRVIERTVYRSGGAFFDGRRSGVYLVDAAATVDGARADDEPTVDRVTGPDADFGGPAFGDDGTLYYWASVGADPDDEDLVAIHALDPNAGVPERIHTTTSWRPPIAATADGRVAFTHIDPDRASLRQTDLHVLDRESGTATDVTAGIDRGVGAGTVPQWGPDEETLYFATPDEGATALWHVPGDGAVAPKRLLREGTVSGVTVGGEPGTRPDEVRLAIARSEWDHPGDVFVHEAGATTRLTRLNESYLADRPVRKPEELWVESERGPVHGWMLSPPGADADDGVDTSPLVVQIHGGPHTMWSAAGSTWHEFRTLAARGYVVLWLNPAGSAGYGAAHWEAVDGNWGETIMRDVLAGVDRVTDRASVDGSNAFLTGGSVGGFVAAWTVGHTDRFRAAVTQRGIYDLAGMYGSTDGAYKLIEGDLDADPATDAAWLADRSPAAHVESVDTPTLLMHAEDDTRTPIHTAELYYRLLRKQGVETRLVRYPREGHGLSRTGEPGHVVDRIERIARWFDGYSDHHDVPTALDRPDGAGLTAGDGSGGDEIS